MNLLSRLRLRTRLTMLLGLSALAVIASIGLAASQMQQRMLTDRIEKLRATTQMFIGFARLQEKQIAAGQLTRQAAVAQLAANLQAMHFDNGNGYVVLTTAMDMSCSRHTMVWCSRMATIPNWTASPG